MWPNYHQMQPAHAGPVVNRPSQSRSGEAKRAFESGASKVRASVVTSNGAFTLNGCCDSKLNVLLGLEEAGAESRRA